MKYHNIEGINLILAILGCSALGFPSEDPARSNKRPFGDCKTYYLGDTKDSVTDIYEMHDESLLAIFPVEVEKVNFQFELHMQETIFRLTLGRTSLMFEKCNFETKRCIVENEEEISHDEYIQSFKWITIKVLTVNQELTIYVGSRLVMSMSLENYPDVSKTWIARFKRVKDYKATKNPEVNANEIRYHEINYLVQFKCQDNETTPAFSVTESTSTTNVFIQILTADDYERPWTHSSTDKESENELYDSAADLTTESTLTDEYATMDVYFGEYELPLNTAIIEGSTTNYNNFTTNPYLEAETDKPDHFEMMSEILYTSLTVVVAVATIIAFIFYCIIKKRRSAAVSQDTTSPDDKRRNSDDGFFEHETSASKEGEYCHCDPVPSSEQV